MAAEESSYSTFPAFVDTNLETHLSILVPSDDTVADLKGKIQTEHLHIFPDSGKISVQTMRVKRRGSFYSLSNSMVVRRAFEGIKGARFLYTDVVPAISMVESQTELDKDVTRERNVQPDKHNLVKTGHDDRNQDSIINELATEKSLTGTSVPDVLGSETLPITQLKSQGLVKKCAREVLGMEGPIIEGDAAAGSRLQQKNKQVANQENKDGRGDDHENAGIGADMGVPIAGKKEKSRKKRNALEVDKLPDGKSEHPNVEKKRHKKVGFSCQHVKETVVPKDSFEEKHVDNLVSLEGFPCKPSHVDSSLKATVDVKRKKKKHILNMTDDTLQVDQAAKGDHAEQVDNHAASRNDSDAVLKTGLPENRVQEKHGTNLVSSEGIPIKPSDIDSSLRAPVDAKQKRKKKKRTSKVDPQHEMVDNSLNKTDDTTQGNQAVEDDHAELDLNRITKLTLGTNVAVSSRTKSSNARRGKPPRCDSQEVQQLQKGDAHCFPIPI